MVWSGERGDKQVASHSRAGVQLVLFAVLVSLFLRPAEWGLPRTNPSCCAAGVYISDIKCIRKLVCASVDDFS